jgi:hypothetical protein
MHSFNGNRICRGRFCFDGHVLNYEPVPAEIGQYVDVWIKVENTGSGKSEDLS